MPLHARSGEPMTPEVAGLRRLRATAREALAFARQATLLHLDTREVCPTEATVGADVVVLVHGLFATAGVLRPLRGHLERATGASTASFSYAPGPGVETVAARLARLVERLPTGVRVHLVGHSLGGLVARWFVQELGGDPRVVETVSLASPFAGTRHARLLPAGAVRDIVPESRVLRRLAEKARAPAGVPHLSIVAGEDSVVTEHAALGGGDEVVIEGAGHNGLLYDPRVAALVASWIARHRAPPDAAVPRRTGPT